MKLILVIFLFFTATCHGEWLLFDSPQCPHCAEVMKYFDTEITNRVLIYDLGEPENYRRFMNEAKKRGQNDIWPGEMPVLMTTNLIVNGQESIIKYFEGSDYKENKKTYANIYLRMFVIGLADGVNPCAFALMIFVCAALRLAGRKYKALLSGAIVFILSVAISYLAMGWGLLSGLRVFMGNPMVRGVIYLSFGAFTLLAAIFAIQAALKANLVIKVPKTWRRWLQRKIRKNVRFGSGLLVIALMGVIASGVESVCTGQVYLPTILMVAREQGRSGDAFISLIIYNLGFILPLCAVAFGAVAGLKATQLEKWGIKQLRWASSALAILFISFSIYLLYWGVYDIKRVFSTSNNLTYLSDTSIFDVSLSNANAFVKKTIGEHQNPLLCTTADQQWYWMYSDFMVSIDFWEPKYTEAPVQSIIPVGAVRAKKFTQLNCEKILSSKKLGPKHSQFVGAVSWWIAWQQKYGNKIYCDIPTNNIYELIHRACESCGEATSFRLITSRYGFSAAISNKKIGEISPEQLPLVVTWSVQNVNHAAVALKKENKKWLLVRFLPNSYPVIIEQKVPDNACVWLLETDTKL